MKIHSFLLTFWLLTATTAAPAVAGSASGDVNVSVAVVPSIQITPPASVNLPEYNSVVPNAPVTATVELTITLPENSVGRLKIGQGQNPATQSQPANPVRRMTDGQGNFLLYDLYQDNGKTQIWGDTNDTALTVNGTGSGSNIPIHIQIVPGQNVPAGTYQDTVTVTAGL